jgi:WD40 repeat protein
MVFSPGGTVFAASPGEGRVTFWRTRTPTRRPGELRSPVGHVNSLAFSDDGKLHAAAGSDRAVVWDAATTKITRVLPVAEFGAQAIAFSPDGATLAMGQIDGSDVIYDLRTGEQVVRFANAGSTDSIGFSPDGKLLASSSLDGSVTVWDVTTKGSCGPPARRSRCVSRHLLPRRQVRRRGRQHGNGGLL